MPPDHLSEPPVATADAATRTDASGRAHDAAQAQSAAPTRATCPIDHTTFGQKKTMEAVEDSGLSTVERGADGTWRIRGFHEARAILRGAETRQAGFRAELVNRVSGAGNVPILYQEGKPHQQQRKQTARFFTPKTVSGEYRQLMESLSDELIADLKRTRKADLSALSLTLAVRVASTVVGLTNSRLPGMHKRLDAFFTDDASGTTGLRRKLKQAWYAVNANFRLAAFFYLDVKPAIDARRSAPGEDVISHLLSLGYNDREILTECITYAAAGMVTTREFISMAAWHMLEEPALRTRYLGADEAERMELLEEILRLEPVVGHLYRCATGDIELTDGAQAVTIPQGALIDLHIHAANADERVTGAQPHALLPGRALRGERMSAELLSFGDGAHRCPGSYIALQESDIFLRRLLALEGLRMEHAPRLTWNDLVTGYELRDFPITLG